VAVRQGLREDDLYDLTEGRTLAIHVPGYYPPDYAQMLSHRLQSHELFGRYANAPDIGRVGMAYFETVNDPERRRRYYELAPGWIQALRDAYAPFQSPMDKLRLQLQEHWPCGANLENIEGRPMFVGLARVFGSGAGAHPHQDVLRRDAARGCARAGSLITQLAANIYLCPSAEGGELELWSWRLSDAEYEALQMPGSYGLDRARLPEPEAVLRPGAGDAILFDATRLHAVRPARGGPRVTVSCFIGYRGRDQPLTYWS
jgi:hypothetical protein